jgi:hypothetical protein
VLHVAHIPRCDGAFRGKIHLPNTKTRTKPSETESNKKITAATTAGLRSAIHYECEGYAQEEFGSESINVNFVCSWTLIETRAGPEINIGNPHCGGWRITPNSCPGGEAKFEQLVHRLREVGRSGKRFEAPRTTTLAH